MSVIEHVLARGELLAAHLAADAAAGPAWRRRHRVGGRAREFGEEVCLDGAVSVCGVHASVARKVL